MTEDKRNKKKEEKEIKSNRGLFLLAEGEKKKSGVRVGDARGT